MDFVSASDLACNSGKSSAPVGCAKYLNMHHSNPKYDHTLYEECQRTQDSLLNLYGTCAINHANDMATKAASVHLINMAFEQCLEL